MTVEIQVPVSVGELFDKISILEIKSERITQPDRLRNVRHELVLLTQLRDSYETFNQVGVLALAAELKQINQKIWNAEDVIHSENSAALSEEIFLRNAKIAFEQNDLRAQVKRKINAIVGSAIVEEKSYPSFA